MDIVVLLLSSIAFVTASGLITWFWLVVDRVDDELRAFKGHEAMDFNI